MIDNIRLGDNVVLQISDLEDYRFFTEPFARQAVKDGKKLVYIRFAAHEPVLRDMWGIKVYKLDPSVGFEGFTVSVHNIITREGREAFYVFDLLSDLQVAWSTDLMMGNFFCVTCPYLFELDTVAYFPVLRAHHSFEALARIRETTQLFLDVYSGGGQRYLHPVKVWNRYSPEMFLPHRISRDGSFSALTNGIDAAGFYSLLHEKSTFQGKQNLDSYERFFNSARDRFASGQFDAATAKKITRSMIMRDRKLSSLILEHLEPQDYFFIKDRMMGTGMVGGKACGMLLARKLLDRFLPEFRGRLEPHDSFFIGSDVFYSYIVENGLWRLKIAQKNPGEYFSAGEELRQRLLRGSFSESIRGQFRRMLEYFGQSPIIVRSSSFLEDGFGNAFAGKYESVFCANAASPDERLKNFEAAVKTVYASTMDRSALEYRKSRGLDKNDEQMAILVQRVSGTKFGDYYMPCAAGTGFSYSVYRWSKELDPKAGMLRLVAGLGTRAVDRTGGDYPRLVNLDKPESTTLTSAGQRHVFSQKTLDVIELSKNTVAQKSAYELLLKLPSWYERLIAEHDREAEERFRESGENRQIHFVSCEGLVKNADFIKMMKDILKTLDLHYGSPVDIEYTVNFNKDGDFVINILQCRPLTVWKETASAELPVISPENTLFKIQNTFMGEAALKRIDAAVLIDSKKYYEYPYSQKSRVVLAIDKINSYYRVAGKTLMLLAPGRIGTSSPELGLPVRFSNITSFGVICEYSDRESGYMPELSYGSHMFQDLVEAHVFYTAVFENESTDFFNRGFWDGEENLFLKICPDMPQLEDIVKVYDTSEKGLTLFSSIKQGAAICGYAAKAADFIENAIAL